MVAEEKNKKPKQVDISSILQASEKTEYEAKGAAGRRSRKFSPVAASLEKSEPVTIVNNRISNTSNPEETAGTVVKKERRGRGAFAAYSKKESMTSTTKAQTIEIK